VQAYFDGEVDAVTALEVERHLERCTECRELQRNLESTRQALRRELPRRALPPPLAARVRQAIDQEAAAGTAAGARPDAVSADRRALAISWRSFWSGAASGIGLSAIAAALALGLWLPWRPDPATEDLIGAHLRSLMSQHLIDVVSSDRHTVKPWFAGHADVSPAVGDFESEGYKLIGGRAEYVARQRSAVLVYQHGAHVIDVFSWVADRARLRPDTTTRNGYQLLYWRQGDLEYCAVADTGREELRTLEQLIRGLP
jgi:anti-sigma factor RsiW